ncbi:efflux RND transporter periplasmic adaptor subunit [Salinispirillum marinum]|uniref:Efflux RND transporter periplasmic adaptor subunit n=2 Tax=Saccharospirillaceae TaxID=255527 RepID=A0ABV8BD01_9GAMM
MSRSLFVTLLSALLLAGGALGYFQLTKTPEEATRPQGRGGAGAMMGRGGPAGAGTLNTTVPTVRTQVAEFSTRQPAITLFGQTQFAQTYQIASPFSSTIERLDVRRGDPVVRNQVLLQLDTRTLERNLAQQHGQILDMQARIRQQVLQGEADIAALTLEREALSLAQDNLRRVQDLQARNLASSADVENARRSVISQQQSVQSRELAVARQDDTLLQLNAQLDGLEQQRNAIEEDIAAATIRAQVNGLVDTVTVQVGQNVNNGSALLTVQSTEPFQIRTTLPSQYLALLDRENPLRGRVDWQGNSTELVLTSWGLNANQGGVSVTLDLIDPRGPLIASTFVPLSLYLPAVEQVMSVPTNALYGNNRLYEVADGRLVERTADIVGEDPDRPGQAYLVRSDMPANADILITRLERPETGLRVQRLNQQAAQGDRPSQRPTLAVED